jgi:DNA polymerase-3 subunit beta
MKKFTIQSDVLREAVKKLQQAIANKAPIPIIDNILVQVHKNEVVFIATDLELTIFYKCVCECDDASDFNFLMPFADVKRIVAVELGELQIAFQPDRTVIIKGNSDEFNLGVTADVTEFPNVTRLPKKNHIELNGTLVESLNAALLTVGKNELQPMLTNILLEFKKNVLNVVSTDAHCLYRKRHTIESDLKEQLMISPKIAKALDGFSKITVYFNSQNIAFESEQITVISKQVDGKYPNYEKVIPESVWNTTCDRKVLEVAINKCNVVESTYREVVFTLGAEEFDLESKSTDTGKSARTMITGMYNGECGNIALNGKQLLTILSQLPKDVEKIRLSITAANKAVNISPEGDDTLLLLTMPIQDNRA